MILSRVGEIKGIMVERAGGWIIPPPSHSRGGGGGEPWSPTCRGKGDISGYGTETDIMCVCVLGGVVFYGEGEGVEKPL